jgi:hypothetical protein
MERQYVMILFALPLSKPDILQRSRARRSHSFDEFARMRFQDQRGAGVFDRCKFFSLNDRLGWPRPVSCFAF